MNLDIGVLVRGALEHSGCTGGQIGNFDGYSTIALELDGLPSVYIGSENNDFWIWSELGEFSASQISYCSDALLTELMRPCDYARPRQAQLLNLDGVLELRVLLGEMALGDPQHMAAALDQFLESLTNCSEALRQ
ncbi:MULTISPECIES: hypothetical protein [Pseudomonas]|uniref:InvB/SpaK family type III secretion system chaperone n=1 Tax=Pseudomonas TaxID=286 RepID=UPI000F57CDD0|nr:MULTISPECIES: hypothetical protein [Pseudomonas]AZF15578.1 hypothetical protein C4J92_2094 [Pseudomonas sp. R3-18-08]AZF26224.1 hypothetical protein C4J90_2051 [Pseudomonas sp. R2-60-08W]AZF31589.1 hypothetical protein C4J89_2114 [Pseudomonas sp. R4-35-07]AZF36864.1 hypothetical protein C4J88_2081 [Pseudomonas sp. R4-39-08]AZF52531.1 hypothetical protein C4J85_2046 [Pseudomonas sp. R4-34-07]